MMSISNLEYNAPYSAEQMAQMYHQLNTAAFLYLVSQAADGQT